MKISETLESQADGFQLFVRRFVPEKPRALVQILHGMGEHSGRYLELMQLLAEAGYLVVAHDHRAMGRSAGANGVKLGAMHGQANWQAMRRDAVALAKALKADYPDLPLVLIGHSMGSFLVQDLMTQPELAEPYAAFALSGSNGKPSWKAHASRLLIGLQRLLQGKEAKATWIHEATFVEFNRRFQPTRTRQDWLSRDPATADAYLADPYCDYVYSTQAWWELGDVLLAISSPARLRQLVGNRPVYLLGGDDDALSDGGAGLRRLAEDWRAAGVSDLELKLYPGARHECFNETNRDEVFADLLDWLQRKV